MRGTRQAIFVVLCFVFAAASPVVSVSASNTSTLASGHAAKAAIKPGTIAGSPGWHSRGRSVAPQKVDVSKLPHAKSGGTNSSRPLLVRDPAAYAGAKKNPKAAHGYAISQSPAAASAGLQSSSYIKSFAGINSADETSASGILFDPPDTQIAVGPTQVIEMVNDDVRITDKSGNLIVSGVSLDSWFILSHWATFFGNEQLLPTDPRVLYDTSTGRWYGTIVAYNPTNFDSITLLGISTTTNAAGPWDIYPMDAESATFFPGSPSAICDQPKLGFSSDKFVIGCSLFNATSTFLGALVMVGNKANGLAGVNMAEDEFGPNTGVFGLVPAQNLNAGVTTAYVTFNESPTAATGVLTLTGLPHSTVLIQHNVAMSGATSAPPAAPQNGSTTPIDTGDDRYMSAFVQGGALYTSGGDSCTPAGDTSPRACLFLVEVNVSTFALFQAAPAGLVGTNLINPTLGVNSSGDVVFEYSTSSSTTYPDIESAIQPAGDVNTFVGGGQLIAGSGPYTGIMKTPGAAWRWGDYGSVAVDPSAPAWVFIAGEFSNGTPTGTTTTWGTEIGEILGHIPQVCTVNQLHPSVASPQKPSVDITLTASATCLSPATPDFQFWIKAPGGALTMVQNYGNGNTYDWAPGTHVTLGTYTLEVLVRGTTETAKAYDSYAVISYSISAIPCAMPTLHTDLTSPQIAGTTVNLTASTGDCPDTTELYQFWIRTPDLVFHPLGAYSATNTAAWNTFNTQIGSYLVEVLIKNTGSTAAFDNFASIPYSMQLCDSPTLSTGTATSPYVSGSGPITLTATGACMGGAQFAFFYEDPANVFHTIQAYSPTATAMWNADYKAGTYRLLVETKPTGSTAAFVSYHFLSPDFTLSGCGTPSLAPDVSSPQIGGASVNWTASVTCSGTANYSFWVRSPAGVFSNPVTYGTANTFHWVAPSTLGTYLVEVLVRNAGANEDPYDSYFAYSYTIGLCSTPTLTPGATSPQPSGAGAISLTATGSCTGGTQFAFFYEDPANVFHTIQAYSPTATTMWNADYKAGNYRLLVEMRPVGSTASYVTYLFVPFTLSGCTLPNLGPDKASPQPPNTQVVFTASATCTGASAQFQFWVVSPTGVFTKVQDYGNANGATFTWTTPTTPGVYTIEVLMRNVNANEDPWDTYTTVKYTVT